MLPPQIRDALETRCAGALAQPAQLCRDALLLQLVNGVALELRFASEHEYAIAWQWGEAQWRIDTAPLHPHLPTFPNHLHDSEGGVHADPLTVAGDDVLANAQRVIEALLDDPTLQRRLAG